MTQATIFEGPSPWEFIDAAFRTALETPRYRELLADAQVDPQSITTLEQFRQRVPVLCKSDLYNDAIPIANLCRGGSLGQPKEVMISSGFSGNNSFATLSTEEDSLTSTAIDEGLAMLFGADQARTLLVNAFGMGIHMQTRHTLAATGPRIDSVLGILSKFGDAFDQVILLGDPHLLKGVVDDGNELGIDWERMRVSFFSGEDWLPETLRSYICAETGIDADDPNSLRAYLQTMGATELGLLLFYESRDAVRLRREAMRRPQLRQVLFQSDSMVVPSLFHFDPRRFHVEAQQSSAGEAPSLIFTTLSPLQQMPLIRYATGDFGRPIDGLELGASLAEQGLGDLMPRLPLPLAWTSGRAGVAIGEGSGHRSDALRHRLYADRTLARSLTGHFVLRSEGEQQALAVQLRSGHEPTARLTNELESLFSNVGETPLRVHLYSFESYPYGFELCFERKFRHEHKAQ